MLGSPIRKSRDPSSRPAPPGLSQVVASFIAIRLQGIRRVPYKLPSLKRHESVGSRFPRIAARDFIDFLFCKLFLLWLIRKSQTGESPARFYSERTMAFSFQGTRSSMDLRDLSQKTGRDGHRLSLASSRDRESPALECRAHTETRTSLSP